MDAFIDIYADPPRDWGKQLSDLGVCWDRTEPQPIADQVKLFDMVIPEGCALPRWVRLGNE